ncbi:HlyD family type I secretion periplasmic adaptor subunit [Cysteiniphilum sp. 6C5]|uniref:HlyD family type I secretion periplasmic adaptor subunit n=1 Tax=unclassified Cysteiniphilum TaxID=2610889 RepID=UPI003F839ABC
MPDQTLKASFSHHIRGSLRFIFLMIGISILIFGLWSYFAPLDSAVIARGQVVVGGNKKIIQHAEGGIIGNILVKDGDYVQADQLLIELDKTKAHSELEAVMAELDTLQVIARRLQAEEAGQSEINSIGLRHSDQRVKVFIHTQQTLLHRRLLERDNQKAIISQRMKQQQTHLTSLTAKARAINLQLDILADKLASIEQLHSQDFVSRHELMALKAEYEQIVSQREVINAEQEETQIKLLELDHELKQLDLHYHKTLSEEYQSVYTKIEELTQRQTFLSVTLARTEIKAPVSGIIADLQYHTLHGVIAAGQKILEIVPKDAPLLVEALVLNKDIKRIAVGMEVKIQLEAYKARRMPKLEGEVVYISADKFDDPQMGGAFYKIHITISAASLAKLTQPIELQTGLPVTVFIIKGQRSLLEYWFDPLRDSFYKAMKEE